MHTRGSGGLRLAALSVSCFLLLGASPRTLLGAGALARLRALLRRFLGQARADAALAEFAQRQSSAGARESADEAGVAEFAEAMLAEAVGPRSARALVAAALDDRQLDADELLALLDETARGSAGTRRLRALEDELAALRERNAQLEELDRLKDEHVSVIAHELRTPLTSIRAFAEILYDNDTLDSAQRDKFLRIIIRECERLTRLIHEMLDLAKIESGTAAWQIVSVDLKDVVAQAVAATGQLFAEQQIQLDLRLPDAVPPVLADPDRLAQVMLNLLSNAAKFCDPVSGKVEIELREQAGMLRVDVRDNGAGISAEDQQVIFERFRQAGDTMTGKSHGTGLGLPICQQLIARFGGKIWVESTPGQGATFSFTLPPRTE